MLVFFLARRVAVLAAFVALAVLLADDFQWAAPLGILLGCFLSLYKTRITALSLKNNAAGSGSGGGMAARIMSQVVLLVILGLAAGANVRLFAGMAAGALLLPLFICVNAVTEYMGFTRNAWGGDA